jgi:hypothetical protein
MTGTAAGTGLDWRDTGVVRARRLPPRHPVTPAAGHLTFRGAAIGFGPVPGQDGDLVVTHREIMADLRDGRADRAALLFQLLPRTGDEPIVVAVPALLAGDRDAVRLLHETMVGQARLPVVQVVAAPIAALATAYGTGALTGPPVAAPILVCEVGEAGVAITRMIAADQRLRCGPTLEFEAPAGDPGRIGVIGAAVSGVAQAHGGGQGAVRLLVCGDPADQAEIVAAADARYRRGRIQAVPVPDPATAVAAGAAAIAAGQVVVSDRYQFGVELATHAVTGGRLDDQWPVLSTIDGLAAGQGGGDVTVAVRDGQSSVTVRLTGDHGTTDVDVALEPPLPAGTYRVGVRVGDDGAALTFDHDRAGSFRFSLPTGRP